jgi:hypothetical protein
MEFEGVKTWLARQAEKQAKICRLKAVAGFVLAPLAVWVAARGVYGFVTIFTSSRYPRPGDAALCFWISVGAIPLMFLGNRVMPRRDLMEERMSGDAADAAMFRYGFGRGQVLLHLILWILFTGPRLTDWALVSMRERRRWLQMDTHSCAAVLWLLASRLKKVPYDEIQREIPWLNLDGVMPELARIPGVLRLQAPPPGLALTDDLRKAIGTGGDLEI